MKRGHSAPSTRKDARIRTRSFMDWRAKLAELNVIRFAVVTQIRLEKQSDQTDHDRQRHHACSQNCERKTVDQASMEIFKDRPLARRDSDPTPFMTSCT